MKKLKPDILRKQIPDEKELAKIKRSPIYIVLDNVLDTYNIGSLFRLSDAVAAEKLYLCGKTEYPPSSRIHKAAVGTENWVPWERKDSALEVIKDLKEKGVTIIAIEQSEKSISYKDLNCDFPVALVCGHETKGVSKEVLKASDIIVELPMLGINTSFNVWGSVAVIAYKLMEKLV